MDDWLAELLKVVALVAGIVVPYLVNRGIQAFERRTDVHLTDQQRATVLGAAETVQGLIATKLATGQLTLDHLDARNVTVAAIAKEALGAVSGAAEALGTSSTDLARIAVGKVGNKIADDPTVPTVASAP